MSDDKQGYAHLFLTLLNMFTCLPSPLTAFPAEEMHWYVGRQGTTVVQLLSDCVQYTNENTTVQHGRRDFYGAQDWDHDAALDEAVYGPPAGVMCSDATEAVQVADVTELWEGHAEGFGR